MLLWTWIFCSIIGFVFSCLGMLSAKENRKLNKRDLIATIFFTVSGPIGTIIIISLTIKYFIHGRRL